MNSTPRRNARLLYRALAVSAVGAGSLGLLLPLLPTTPFLLLALWAASRGSPELHARIRANQRFGPTLRAWETHRAVPVRAKWLACLTMTASWLILLWMNLDAVVLGGLAALFAALMAFLVTRPASSLEAAE